MIKKALTLVLAMALLVVSGPLEVFAAGEEDVAEIPVTVDSITEETAHVGWETVPGATSYAVILNDEIIESELPPSFEYTLTGLTENTDYTVKIRAVSEGVLLGEGEAHFVGGVQENPAEPEVGTITVTADNVTSSSADVSWIGVNNAYYYELLLNEDVVGTDLNETAYNLTGLKGSTNYTVTVLAHDVDDSVLAEGSADLSYKYSRSASGCLSASAIALAASIGEPPPMPITKSIFSGMNLSLAANTVSVDGFSSTSENIR